MKSMTKKRIQAYCIDAAIAAGATLCTEYILRKKVKNETIKNAVAPSVIMYALEYMQLKRSGRTIGYRCMGLTLEDAKGNELSSGQIVKRMVYRDFISQIQYIAGPKKFEREDGSVLPQDSVAGTVVKEN